MLRPSTISQFTSPGLIVPHLRGRDAAEVIQELSQAMHREGRVPDVLPFYQAALNREFLVSSDTEAGMAFPHARVAGVDRLSFALGHSDEPLNWSGTSGRSVDLVFLLAVPPGEATQYLLLIAGLVRLAKESRLVEELRGARDADHMFQVFQKVPLRSSTTFDSSEPALRPGTGQ